MGLQICRNKYEHNSLYCKQFSRKHYHVMSLTVIKILKEGWEICSSSSPVELSSASGENDTRGCPAEAQHMIGRARFQPTTTLTFTHTNPVTRTFTYTHLHTGSHLLSVLRDACWVHTHNKARISTIKLSAGKEAMQNHTLLSLYNPHPLIITWPPVQYHS